MEHLLVYIPMSRRHALANSTSLPNRTRGAALFADISGFTPLTEALVFELGPVRGAEELTRILNLVYDALIEELHRHGGSAIAFAGDAVTCWFDDDNGLLATACALAMQQAMAQFAALRTPAGGLVALTMKAAVAAGAARRFLVGDPAVRVIDALAGETLVRLALAEQQAHKGEILLDEITLREVDDAVEIAAIRLDESSGRRFGVVRGLHRVPQAVPWPALRIDQFQEEQIRSWLLPPVYERLSRGMGDFLAELRPTVALFLRFDGIDYDHDPAAGEKLDAYIRWVQQVIAHYDGTLIDLNIGDKGSYVYANFGALLTHENDASRAAKAALALRNQPATLSFIKPVQIGISQGRTRVGAYGGAGHRTYGALGDEVNLAARLMMRAAPGQILVSEAAQRFMADAFQFDQLPSIQVKGKRELVTVFALRGAGSPRHLRLPAYALPMIGRAQELAQIDAKLEQAAHGQGQLVAVIGEPGVGKSRLVTEAMKRAEERGWHVYAGACESYGINSSYLVWQPVWRALFGLDPLQPAETQIERVAQTLASINESFVPRLPLLDTVLQLSIPANALTQSLDAKVRKTALESLLVELLRAMTEQSPTLIVLEDCHWLDPLSHALLHLIAEAIHDRPICLIVAHRELELERLRTGMLGTLPYYNELRLAQFTDEEAMHLVALKLAQLEQRESALPPTLLKRLIDQAQGNPFYLEELITYLHYQGITPQSDMADTSLALPDSLHRLVLSRLDQLSERQKITVKVASVIGRVFRASWLAEVYPLLGDHAQVVDELTALQQQELTLLEPDEPELTYFFKQVITQNVTYESLPHAVRVVIHQQIGHFIEQRFADSLDQYLDLLAHHYDRSEDEAKRREYLRRAGEAAQTKYANLAALDYYQRLLDVLPATERLAVQLKLGQVLELIGRWDEAKQLYGEALAHAQAAADQQGTARVHTAMGELLRKQGDYRAASKWLRRAQTTFESLDNAAGLGQVYHIGGTLAAQQGKYKRAQALYEKSLAIRQQLDERASIASLLSNLGILARFRNDYTTARALYEESLAIRRALQDPWAIANSLNNLGLIARYQNDYPTARTLLAESLAINREVGDPWATANTLTSLAEVALDQQDFAAAEQFLTESLAINRKLGDKRAIAFLLESFSTLAATQVNAARALTLAAAAAALRAAIQAPLSPAEQERLDQTLAVARQALRDTEQEAAQQLGRTVTLEQVLDTILDDAPFPPA